MLTFFFIKPLFARRPAQTRPLVLDLAAHPRLRELITAICAKIGAPLPARVEIDCEVNASARLRRGLLSVGRHDYVLTLGLPLVAGLDSRQFAGVVAHELGHFAQGAGMSSSHIIRAINQWFARVVFERDPFDRQLERAMEKHHHNGYVGVVLACVIALIWVGRKTLHGLMLVGNTITCLQLRQMERDADYYQTAICGSASFAATVSEMQVLAVAHATALQGLGSLWQHGRLTTNYPAYVVWQRTQPAAVPEVPPEARRGRLSAWFATHPSRPERVALASALGRR
jgi:Zn-dependent protease with chaperone function